MVVWEEDTLFQTFAGTGAYDGFGYCVALSTDTHTLMVGASGVDSGTGEVVVHHHSTTTDQFTLHNTFNGEKENGRFGLAIAMTPMVWPWWCQQLGPILAGITSDWCTSTATLIDTGELKK